jgi:hypothetical protein
VCDGMPYPMYSDIFAVCCERWEGGGGEECLGCGCGVARDGARVLMLVYHERAPAAESVRARSLAKRLRLRG